jgi:Helicase conserved C-terminal domain
MPSKLADHLRALPDDGLTALIKLRPDLVVPVPADISALAHRAQSRVSVARALDGLDRFTLEVLDALRFTRVGETTSVESVLAMTASVGVEATRVRSAIDRLTALSIVYGPESALRVVGAVDEVSTPYPAGLGRTAEELDAGAATLVADAAGLRRTLLAAPPAARAVLDRLAAGPPRGAITPASLVADAPVRWLLDRHLLVQVGADEVELPREVALLLRRDAGPLGPLHPEPPPLRSEPREPAAADQAGAGQVLELVRTTEALLEAVAADPPPVLRAGGMGIRDLRRLAKFVGVADTTVAVLLEVASAAGLLGEAPSTSDGVDLAFLPTSGYDGWRASAIAARWHRLAHAWLRMGRAPALVGQRDERDKLINALSHEVSRPSAPSQRAAALDVLATLPPGSAPTPADVLEVLTWRAPRRAGRGWTGNGGPAGATAALSEAALLGITGSGALTGYGRMLLGEVSGASGTAEEDPLGVLDLDESSGAVSALDALLPAPVDHVLVQADLTVVVPGPPEPSLAAELELVAVAESASVYRVTAESVRRSLDTGYSAADLHGLFARRSRTPVPQALTYLVDDVARRHGGLRVGTAGSYLRGDDEALIAEVAADRRLAALQFRRLAPTVLASRLPVVRLLEVLRDTGYAPVPEDASGAAVLTRPKVRRAAPKPSLPYRAVDPYAVQQLSAPRLAGIVEQLRRGDALARAARRAPVSVRVSGVNGSSHAQALAVLQQAVRDRARVWVGYVDAHGAPASRLVRPVSIGSGYLRAEDDRTETLHTFALHRITAAVLED